MRYEKELANHWNAYVKVIASNGIFEKSMPSKFVDFPLVLSLEIIKEQKAINVAFGTNLVSNGINKANFGKETVQIHNLEDISLIDGNENGDQSEIISGSIEFIYSEYLKNADRFDVEGISILAPLHYHAIHHAKLESKYKKILEPMVVAEYNRLKEMI